jgi:hypothetical protein
MLAKSSELSTDQRLYICKHLVFAQKSSAVFKRIKRTQKMLGLK